MYPNNSYLEKRSPSPTFVNITTTPFDYNLPSEQITTNHHHHHPHHHHQHRHHQHHNKNLSHGSMKFAKTKAGLVTGTTNIDQTELIYPEDAYSIEFCMPNDVACKCPPTISSQTGISTTTTYRDSSRRKSKNKPEISNRWTRKTSTSNGSTDHNEQHQSLGTTSSGHHHHEILNLENYCSPKQLPPPIYDVYSYAYLEPPPPPSQQQQQQQQILDQTQLHHPLHKHHPHQHKQASTSSTTSTTSSSSSTSFMPIYGGGGPSTSSGGSTSSSSKSPSRNSIKALLAKSFRNRANITNSHHTSRSNSASAASSSGAAGTITTEKYTFTTRYGTTENLYEEVNEEKIREILSTDQIINQPSTSQMSSTSSSSPPPPQPPPINSKEEQRRVQNNHFRILDELNLSLEALIMPPTPPDISPTTTTTIGGIILNQENLLNGSKSVENISSALSSIDFKENIKERFYKTRNKIDCILKDNGSGGSSCSGSGGGGCGSSGLGDLDSGLSISSSSYCNNDNFKNRLDDKRFSSTMSHKNQKHNYKDNYCNNDNNSSIAMTLISPSSPFKSMKRYFDGSSNNTQKLSPNDDCSDIKTKNSNKFWTIRQ